MTSATTSIGHEMADASWIDAHYLACRREYEQMLSSVGLQPGWHVLDAGCGSGAFLPIISRTIGPSGRITAVDVAPEHIADLRRRITTEFACAVEANVGDLASLPVADSSVDAIWSANVFQYFAEAQQLAILAEFTRVLRPGGLLAIKDGDISALQISPVHPLMLWRLLAAWANRDDPQAKGLLQGINLSRVIEAAGYRRVARSCTFIERSAPLRSEDVLFLSQLMSFLGSLAKTVDLPQSDRDAWQKITDANSPAYVLKESDFYFREAAILVLARKST